MPDVNLPPPFEAYTGDEPCIFVSYRHLDGAEVFEDLKELHSRGYRIWYDEGIDPGNEWPEEIARAIDGAAQFLVFITENAIESVNVRNEINYALKKGKPFLAVHLSDVDLPEGLELQMGNIQAILKWRMTPDGYWRKLEKTLPEDLIEEHAPRGVRPAFVHDVFISDATKRESQPSPSTPPSRVAWWRRWPLWASLALALLMVLILGQFWPRNRPESAPTPGQAAAISRTPTPPPFTVTPAPAAPTPAPLPSSNTPVPPTPASELPTPAATAMLAVGSTMMSEKDGMELVYVPAGELLMGSTDADEDAFASEKPQHSVYLDAFWIDRTEVSNQQYRLCVAAGWCVESAWASFNTVSGDQLPVMGVNWEDARNYCEWAGRRLPTEAEWEKAARGTDGRIYPWGNDAPTCELAQYHACGNDTVAVGSKPLGVSPYGALDMAGNASEWVYDLFDEEYYSRSPARNPSGPSSGKYRVMRGGSSMLNASYVCSYRRVSTDPDNRHSLVGFRCAASSTSSP